MSASQFNRDCGLLLHPTSLPNPYGIGDFGPSSLCWIERLASAGQNIWQILPLNPAGYGDSPYQGLSAFAVNPVFLSPEDFYARGLLGEVELSALQLPCRREVDYSAVYQNKRDMNTLAAERFFALDESDALRVRYRRFLDEESDWLECYALFAAIKESQGGVAWTDWEPELRDRNETALRHIRSERAHEIDRIRFEQFMLWEQWQMVRAQAARLGVRIVGDLPIFVAHDSADVWCSPELFRLNEDGSPSVVAGVPPDYFSSTGQLWGNPLYAWDRHREDGFAWWCARLKKILAWVDVVRVDHFRGFEAFWEVPGGAKTAAGGKWVKAPGREVFSRFEEVFGQPLPVIAEDLGVITPEVDALRDDFGLPGIRIEQFAFGTDPKKGTFLPEAYDGNCVAYTGTHDNDTVVGWFNSVAGSASTRTAEQIEAERQAAMEYFQSDGSEIHWDFIKSLLHSDAAATVMPVQDVLGLGSEARMNTPGVASGSWKWRLTDMVALDQAFPKLSNLTASTKRGLTREPESLPIH